MGKPPAEPELKAATEKALGQFQQALSHIEAAWETIAGALKVACEDRPELDFGERSEERRDAVRLGQNIWDARMHVNDPTGS